MGRLASGWALFGLGGCVGGETHGDPLGLGSSLSWLGLLDLGTQQVRVSGDSGNSWRNLYWRGRRRGLGAGGHRDPEHTSILEQVAEASIPALQLSLREMEREPRVPILLTLPGGRDRRGGVGTDCTAQSLNVSPI